MEATMEADKIMIRRSTVSDKAAIIELADRAFGGEVQPGGFAVLLPKLYGSATSCEGNHLLLFEGENLQAMLLTESMRYRVGGRELSLTGIGTVAVDSESRSKGYMRLLMDEAMVRLTDEGCDLIELGGHRHRYGYWGFEPCGLQTCYKISPSGIRHVMRGQEVPRLTLQPMCGCHEEKSTAAREKETALWMAKARELWSRELVHTIRKEESFADILCSWRGVPYVCLLADKVVGYVVLRQEQETAHVLELVLGKEDWNEKEYARKEEYAMQAVLQAVFESLAVHECHIKLPAYKQEWMRQLEILCEEESVNNSHMYRILNWQAVIQAFMEVKTSYGELDEGKAVLHIREADGKTVHIFIQVKDNHPKVWNMETEGIEASEGMAELDMTAARASRVLFQESLITRPELQRLPHGWFPIPLYIAEQDCC